MNDNNITSQTNNLNIKKPFKDKINFDAVFTGLFALVAVLFSSFVMSGLVLIVRYLLMLVFISQQLLVLVL